MKLLGWSSLPLFPWQMRSETVEYITDFLSLISRFPERNMTVGFVQYKIFSCRIDSSFSNVEPDLRKDIHFLLQNSNRFPEFCKDKVTDIFAELTPNNFLAQYRRVLMSCNPTNDIVRMYACVIVHLRVLVFMHVS